MKLNEEMSVLCDIRYDQQAMKIVEEDIPSHMHAKVAEVLISDMKIQDVFFGLSVKATLQLACAALVLSGMGVIIGVMFCKSLNNLGVPSPELHPVSETRH